MTRNVIITLCILLLFTPLLLPQNDSPVVTVSGGMAQVGYAQVLTYSGTNLTYRCVARSTQDASTIAVTAATNANPVVFTATAHGLNYQSGATMTPAVFISGATSGWTGVNGMFIATPTSANAFSIPVDSTTFGSFSGQTLTVTTRAPKVTANVWAIQKLVYDGSNNLIWAGWATDTTGTTLPQLRGGVTSFAFACASQTTYSFQ